MKHILKSKIFISAVIVIAAVAMGVIIAMKVSHSDNDLQTQLDLGQKYTSELDYENAIIAYEKALEIDPYCLDAYLGLADVYSALGQQDKAVEIMEQAKSMLPDSVEIYESLALLYASQNQIDLVVSTLEEGIRATDSDRLREMLREYQPNEVQVEVTESNGVEITEEEAEEEKIMAEDQEAEESADAEEFQPELPQQEDMPVLTITQAEAEPIEIPIVAPGVPTVGGNSYDNTNESDGNSSNNDSNHSDGSDSDDVPVLPSIIEGIVGNVYGTNGQGISDVTVTVYPESGEEPIIATTDVIGAYLQSIPAGTHRVVLSKEGYADLDTTTTVWSSILTNCNYVMLTTQERQQLATIQGVVVSATDAQRVEGVTVTLLNGFNAYAGQEVSDSDKHTTTGSNGEFSIDDDLNADYYTVVASKDGYSTYIHNETIKPGQNELTINMSPTIQSQGEYRIVLSWGEIPRDLDSHLMCSGNNNYHIYFGDKNSSDGNASLDRDDTNSYGPETITVIVGDGNSYTYAVHNFTDQSAVYGEDRAWNLAQSNAKVVVYDNSGIIFEGNVPTNAQGTTWEVFRIEDGQLLVTNNVSFDHPTVLKTSEDEGIMAFSVGDDVENTIESVSVTETKGTEESDEVVETGDADGSEAAETGDADGSEAAETGDADGSEVVETGDADGSEAVETGDADESEAVETGDADGSEAVETGDADESENAAEIGMNSGNEFVRDDYVVECDASDEAENKDDTENNSDSNVIVHLEEGLKEEQLEIEKTTDSEDDADAQASGDIAEIVTTVN